MEKIIKELDKLIKKALKRDESPVAALIVYNGKIISKGYNRRNKSNMTTDHAEIIAINTANKKMHSWRLNKCTLYVTLEPCEMCKSVIAESRIENVYFFLTRNPEKKQYKGTKIVKIDHNNNLNREFTENYKKIMHNFWENKR